MNQFVAPTSFITSISRRRANIAVRIVFQISTTATTSSTTDATIVTPRTNPESLLYSRTVSLARPTS